MADFEPIGIRCLLLQDVVLDELEVNRPARIGGNWIDQLGLPAFRGESTAGGSHFIIGQNPPRFLQTDSAVKTLEADARFSHKIAESVAGIDEATKDLQFVDSPSPGVQITRYVKATGANALIRRIYDILGGAYWDPTNTTQLNFEQLLRDLGPRLYDTDGVTQTIRPVNLLELIYAVASVNFHRAGYQQLPAELPASMREPANSTNTIQIPTALEFQSYLLKALDDLLGAFPVEWDFQGRESTATIKYESVSDSLVDMGGLIATLASEIRDIEDCLARLAVETTKAHISAMQATDYSKANAYFAGYAGEEVDREIDIPFTFRDQGDYVEAFQELLKDSPAKFVGWSMEGQPTYTRQSPLQGRATPTTSPARGAQLGMTPQLGLIMQKLAVIEAAVTVKFRAGDQLPDDRIKDKLRAEEREWDQTVADLRNTPPQRRNPAQNAVNLEAEVQDLSNRLYPP